MIQLEEDKISGSGVGTIHMKLEVVVIPVSDVDRAKEFYGRPSIQFGTKVTPVAHDSAQSLYLVVSDIMAVRDQFVARRVDVSEVSLPAAPVAHFQPDGSSARLGGPAPDHASYHSYATFSDPDGNRWLLKEVTTRLPGHVDLAGTVFASVNDLASALRCVAAAHGEHEKRIWQRDANRPDWYAAYTVAEQSSQELPQ